VAGFIGKTNLVTGSLAGGRMHLEGLSEGIPLLTAGADGASSLQVSIRPQSLFLGTATGSALALGAVSVVGRTYLGEYWDYLVQPAGGGAALKVHAPPSSVFEVGQASVLYIDPEGVAAVQ
jgi:iron(III) transport system ATP-binding protein/putative spermidine/putrescine transport system ATP-binding protein